MDTECTIGNLDFIMQEFKDTEQSEAQGDMCKDRIKPD